MRRRLITVAVFLLAGAVVNVAVAWGFGVWSNPFHGRYAFDGEHSVGIVEKFWSRGATVVLFPGEAPPLSDLIPNWGELEEPPLDLDVSWASESRYVYGAGWPARALWCEPIGVIYWDELMHSPPVLLPTHGYVETSLTPWQAPPGVKIPTPLPLRPIWPGFAINTFFYAAILWLLIPGPFALRRLIRQRRGLCPKCAYPMGESAVCTECGAELPTKNRSESPFDRALRSARGGLTHANTLA